MRTLTSCTAAALLLTLTGCTGTPAQPSSRDVFAMDTYMQLKVWSQDGDALLDQAAGEISRLESLFSATLPGSDIDRINHAAGAPVEVSEETARLLERSLAIGQESGGALALSVYPITCAWGFPSGDMHVPDPVLLEHLTETVDDSRIVLTGTIVTVPDGMQLDLGAVAKGFTSDAVIALLRDGGAEAALLSLGGNVQALGTRPDGSLWRVGVTDPFSPQETMCVVEIADKAVITSGNYERCFEENGVRYHHILDPADGFPADNGLVSVTVIGDSGVTCDALSTALFVEGRQGAAAHWQQYGGFDMILVTEDAQILYTEGLEGHFENQSSMPVQVIRHE